MQRNIYAEMGDDLRKLFENLGNPSILRTLSDEIVKKATLIGGSIAKEGAVLHADIVQFLKSPKDQKCSARLKKHALRLEQETREL